MELVVARLVKPSALDVGEGQAGHETRKGERVAGELRNGLVRAGIRFVIEDMDRAVAYLQKIDVAGDES